MEQHAREKRVEQAYAHFYGLLDDIVSSEEAMVQGVISDLEKRRTDVNQYRSELLLSEFDETLYPPRSIPLLKAFEKELHRLEAKRSEILAQQSELYHRLNQLYRRLANDVPSFEGIQNKVLPANVMEDIKTMCSEAETELAKRLDEVLKLQAQAKLMTSRLTEQDVSEDEKELIYRDFLDTETVIPADLPDKFRRINDALHTQYEEWLQQASFEYDELIFKLEDLYEKLSVEESERVPMDKFNPEEHGVEYLTMLRHKFEHFYERYQRGKIVFDKFAEWQRLFKEKVGYEDAATGTDFYNNRGGALNQRLKRINFLEKHVPQVQQELAKLVEEFTENMDDIMVDGVTPDKKAEQMVIQHELEKEQRRMAKHLEKQRQLEEETKYRGSPLKRTPMKTVKATPTPLKGKHRKRSISCTNLSVITPVRSNADGNPMTSSPKNCSSESFLQTYHTPTSTPIKKRKMGQENINPRTPARTPKAVWK
jgi:hypothetical protein